MLADLLSECFAADLEETWECKRTANTLTSVAVRLHVTGCSLRETTSILVELGVKRTHGAVWKWVHRLAGSVPDPTTTPSLVTVDETAARVNSERSWLYTTIYLDTNLILDVQ